MNLSEMYDDKRKQPSPSQAFLIEIANLTCRSIQTVKQWISRQQTPPEAVKLKIARHFGKSVDELFPCDGNQ